MKLVGPFRKAAGMSKRDHGAQPGLGAIHFEVPFIQQNHINLCGDASASMLLMYHGRPAMATVHASNKHANVFKLKENPRGTLEGADTEELKAALRASGLHLYRFRPYAATWTAQSIGDVLRNYGPFMALVRFSPIAMHWLVIKGLDGTNVLYHDSWRGRNMSMAAAHFGAVSNGRDPEAAIGATPAPVVAAGLSVQVLVG